MGIVILLVCFFIFFFSLYLLSKDDLLLLRKNVDVEEMFNQGFLFIAVGLFFARVFYIVFHFKNLYLNPLVFFYFTKYPGFSLTGGLLAGAIFLYFYLARRKVPINREFDIYALSFMSTIPFLFISTFFTHQNWILYSVNFLFPLMYIIFFVLLIRVFLQNRVKEGSTGLLVLVIYSVLTIIHDSIYAKDHIIFFFGKEDVLLLGLFVITFVLFLQVEFMQRKFGK